MGMINFLFCQVARCKMKGEAFKVWKADAGKCENESEGHFDCQARQMSLPACQRRCEKCSKEFRMELAIVVPINLEIPQRRHRLEGSGDPGHVLPQSLLKSGLCFFPCVVRVHCDFHESDDGVLCDTPG